MRFIQRVAVAAAVIAACASAEGSASAATGRSVGKAEDATEKPEHAPATKPAAKSEDKPAPKSEDKPAAKKSAKPDAAEETELVRVVALARHGNRAPNSPLEKFCPAYVKDVLPGFRVPFAALSPVGIAENWECGAYLRNKYMQEQQLLSSTYADGGETNFFSERMDRNVNSMEALVQGVFPIGTGLTGYVKERPNLVPIQTTQAGVDRLMNCPRDGPCRNRFKADFAAWVSKHQEEEYHKHKDLLETVAKACGGPALNPEITFEGKTKSLPWVAKVVSDGFSFAKNEGLNYTINGRLSEETITQFKAMAGEMVKGTRFSSPEQITYWLSDFGNTLLRLTKVNDSPSWRAKKLHVLLNHRELLYALGHALESDIAFPGYPVDVLPSGSAIVVEVHQGKTSKKTFLKMKWWMPSQPDLKVKAKAVQSAADEQKADHIIDHGKDTSKKIHDEFAKDWRKGLEEVNDIHKVMHEGLGHKAVHLLSLYSTGVEVDATPKICKGNVGGLCPWEDVAKALKDWTDKTGTFEHLCDIDNKQKAPVSFADVSAMGSLDSLQAVGEVDTEDMDALEEAKAEEPEVATPEIQEGSGVEKVLVVVLAPVAILALAAMRTRREAVHSTPLLG